MHFALLGPLAVSYEGGAMEIRGSMPRAVLAALLLNSNTAVSTDQLIHAVWGDQPPPSATAALHNHLTRLRRWLGKEGGARIRAVAPGYLIRVEPGELDLHLYAELCASGREAVRDGRWAEASADLTTALGLWRGRPVADVPDLYGHDSQIQRLLESRLLALEGRVEADLQLGRQQEVIGELRVLVAEHPLREVFHGQLMLALYRADRQAEALEVFQELRRVLVDELGVEPSVAVRELFQRILRAEVPSCPGEPAQHGPAQHGPAPRGPAQLPADTAAFTGRTEQVRQALEVLPGGAGVAASGLPVPVVSVVCGTAGSGKTALAVHVGHRVRDDFPDGQLYTSLGGSGASPRDPGDVAGVFLAALGVDAAAIPQDPEARAAAYRSALADLRVLIVLDDASDAAQVRPLIPGSGGCAVLVTSRSRIAGLPGSRLLHLDGLGDAEARTLLAHSVGADRLADEAEATAGILVACSGLPLALAIAGARLASRPQWKVQDLADRLRPAHRRLNELAHGDLAVRAAFDLSFAALGGRGPQGGLLARFLLLLGLWTGPDLALEPTAALLGVDLPEAEQALEHLVDLNLVESPAARVYRLHDLVHAYALEHAVREVPQVERSAAVARLVTWYLWAVDGANAAAERVRRRLALLEQSGEPVPPPVPGVPGPVFADAAESFTWLGAERLNLMAAVRLAAEYGQAQFAGQLPWLLEEFHLSRWHHADWSELCAIAVRSARDHGDVAAEARLLSVAANHLQETRDHDQALVFRQRVLDLHRQVGNREKEANTMVSIGIIHLGAERHQQAIDSFTEAIPLVRSASSPFALAAVLNALGEAYSGAERFDEAIGSFRESLAAARAADSRFAEAATLDGLGVTYQRCGRTTEAVECLRQAVTIQQELAEGQGEARSLDNLAASLLADGRPEEARRCWQRALTIFTELSHPQADAVAGRLRALVAGGS